MPEEGKERMSVWVEPQDREAMRKIRDAYGLPTDSAAIRFAIRFLAGDPKNQRRTLLKRPFTQPPGARRQEEVS